MGCCASNDDDKEDKKEPLILSSVNNSDNSLTQLNNTHRKSAQELLLSWNLQHYYDILVAKDYLPIDKWEYLDKNTLMFELNFAPDDATNFIAEVSMYFDERRKSLETQQMKDQIRRLTEQVGTVDSKDTDQLHHHDDHSHDHDHHNHNHDTIDLPDEKNMSQTISVEQEDDRCSDDELHGNPHDTHKHEHETEHSHSHSHDHDDTPHDDDDIIHTQQTGDIVIEDQSDLDGMKKHLDYLRKRSGLDVDDSLIDDLNNNNIETEEIDDDELHNYVETKDIDIDESDEIVTDEDME